MRVASSSLAAFALACATCACSDPPTTPSDAGMDTSLPAAPLWPRDLPDLSSESRRGRRLARTVIHLHTPLSHDACDGDGWLDGGLADPACLTHLRDAICTLRVDTAMLTDHAPHIEEVAFEDLLWMAPGDVPIMNAAGTGIVAARWACANGHRPLITAGSENALMPVSLRGHVVTGTDQATLRAAYDADGLAAVTSFRDAGGLVLIPHPENRDLATLRMLSPDGMEIYNTHASIAPDIRAQIGLLDGVYVTHLLTFTDRRYSHTLAPDLMFLAFYERLDHYLDKWDTLLSEGVHIAGFAACDAHENAFRTSMIDGERGDSYRRAMRWFTNHLLTDDMTIDATADALKRGRLYAAFEVFGTPMGFDFVANASGATYEMGEDAPLGATLTVQRPSLPPDFPATPAPTIEVRLLRSDPAGAIEVATGAGPTLSFMPTIPGAYRAEVIITPEHTRPYLGRLADALIRPAVWVYSNPIHVR